MDFIKNIKNNSLLIIPNNIKEKVIEYISSLDRIIDVKILSLNELKKELLFNIDDESILFLMDKYNLKKEVAVEYLNNIYYVDNKSYNNEKLDKLVEMKNLLLDNNLINNSNFFLNKYKDKNIYVYGYDYIDSFNNKLLSYFNNVEIITKDKVKESNKVYGFNSLNEELLFVLENVVKLIDNNVPLNKIVICNTDDDYKKELYKLFNMSNILIDIDNNSSIASTVIGNKVLSLLKETNNIEDTLDYIVNNYDLENDYNNKVYMKILSIINKYNIYDYNFNIKYDCIKNDLSKETIDTSNNGIRVESFSNNIFNDDEYIFLVNFNDGNIPVIHKDEEFITDNIKNLLGLDKTNILNDYEKSSLINNILSTKNLYISYKLKYKEDEFYPSSLIDNKVLINDKYEIDYNTCYSKKYIDLKLASEIDNLIKYDKKSTYLDTLYNSTSIPYRTYDNKYKAINKEDLKEYLNNKVNLSYSNINTFYNCSFRFYLDNILKINTFDESFDTNVGSLFHYCLSKINEDDFDLDKYWNEYLKDRDLSSKEKFYLNKLKKELIIIVDFIKEFNKDTGLTNIYTEKKIEIDKSKEMSVCFKGFIDKIMYKEYDGNTLVSIIDYKTGSAECDIHDSIYGLSMQLPIYLYLIDKGKIFDSYKPVGLYLQKILSGEVNIDENKSYIEQKYSNLKLNGYSTDNILDLSRFDPTYESSKYISSMKMSSKGFYQYAKTLSEEEMHNIVNLVDKNIDNAIDSIENAKFDINPKHLSTDKEITGCKYCSYKDICFRKNEDIKEINKYKDLSFLKSGDNNE